MRLFFYLAFIILSVNLAQGSVLKKVGTKTPKVTIADSTGKISVRGFDTLALKKYSEQREFKYTGPAIGPSLLDRLWDRFWNWFWHLFNFKDLSVLGVIWNILEILVLLVGIGALVYFILKAAGIEPEDIFKRRSIVAPVPYSEFFEDINTIDFDAEIENAVSKHNYRLAVRMMYLKCLKQLSNAGLIDWQIDKTNNQYLYELKDSEQRTAFGSLTKQFEYVWYGEFTIDNQVYNSIAHSFRNFNTQKG